MVEYLVKKRVKQKLKKHNALKNSKDLTGIKSNDITLDFQYSSYNFYLSIFGIIMMLSAGLIVWVNSYFQFFLVAIILLSLASMIHSAIQMHSIKKTKEINLDKIIEEIEEKLKDNK